jgi:hypothetical protein
MKFDGWTSRRGDKAGRPLAKSSWVVFKRPHGWRGVEGTCGKVPEK